MMAGALEAVWYLHDPDRREVSFSVVLLNPYYFVYRSSTGRCPPPPPSSLTVLCKQGVGLPLIKMLGK